MEHDDECNACGSSLMDRERRVKQYPGDDLSTDLMTCPHCGSSKCIICDMGDNTECPACHNEERA